MGRTHAERVADLWGDRFAFELRMDANAKAARFHRYDAGVMAATDAYGVVVKPSVGQRPESQQAA